MKKKQHIPKLDDFLGGGIPEGKSILFCAVPGVECEAFGYQIINAIMKKGIKVLSSPTLQNPTYTIRIQPVWMEPRKIS